MHCFQVDYAKDKREAQEMWMNIKTKPILKLELAAYMGIW